MSHALAIAFSEGRTFRHASYQICQTMFACKQTRYVGMLDNNDLWDSTQQEAKIRLATATHGEGSDGIRGKGRGDARGAALRRSKQKRKRQDCDSNPVIERAVSHDSKTSHESETSYESE